MIFLLLSGAIFYNGVYVKRGDLDANQKLNITKKETYKFIKDEARIIEDALRAIRLSNKVARNHFTTEQIKTLTSLARKFINCTKNPRLAFRCSSIRDMMNNVYDNDVPGSARNEKAKVNLNGPFEILLDIGISYANFNNPKSLTREYTLITESLPDRLPYTILSVEDFSRLTASEMRQAFQDIIYPNIRAISDGFITEDAAPTSEEMWDSMPKCEDAIGYYHIDRDATDKSNRCEYSQLDEYGLIKNKEYPLKYFTPCIKSQTNRSTCSSFSPVGALEIRLLRNLGVEYNLSEQFTYFYNEIYSDWWGRFKYNTNTINSLKKLMKEKIPIPLEQYWVYNPASEMEDDYHPQTKSYPSSCNHYSGQRCTDFAFQTTESRNWFEYTYEVPYFTKPYVKISSVSSFFDIFDSTGSLDTAIYYVGNGDPVIISFSVTNSYMEVPEDHYIYNTESDSFGGHANVLVGFVRNEELPPGVERATEKGFFIMRNSWGWNWADCGHVYVDYAYLKKHTTGLAHITYYLEE